MGILQLCPVFARSAYRYKAETAKHYVRLNSLRALGFTLVYAMIVSLLAFPAHAIIPSMESGSLTESSDLKPFPKWTSVLSRFSEQDRSAQSRCTAQGGAACRVVEWHRMLAGLKNLPARQQVDAVNSYFNQVTYIQDTQNWGSRDYWATPQEFLSRSGDCEDYAIAKYLSLRKLGFSTDQMRVTIVQDMNLGGIMHSILIVKVSGEELILDNQISHVRPIGKLLHYKPIYSINETAWWRF